jgi:two-component system, chemotaxis family, sensor kinase Cph1
MPAFLSESGFIFVNPTDPTDPAEIAKSTVAMNEITDFFSRLGDTSDWPPRWYCGTWSDFHGWLYIVSDLMIWLAYISIPLILIRFVLLKRGIPLKRVFWLFGAFILLCGLTHLLDAVLFWVPIYRISALVRFLTGLVSIGTVVALIKYFDDALGLRTSQEYEFELQYRQKALEALERTNEELRQFAHVASHDLQSPLKTIEGYLGLLETRYGGQLDETGQRLVKTSAASAGRMRTLITELLEYSQSGLSHNLTDIDMNLVVQEVQEEMSQDILENDAEIVVGELPTLRASEIDMKRVFQNLISNALKYHRKDARPKIRIWAQENEKDWLFCVSDNGIGIEEAYFEKIFMVFQRLHGRNEYPGTGVGLATCKKIIETHSGKIWLTSEAHKGSNFYFTIPKGLKTLHDYQQNTEAYTTSGR